MQAILLHVQCCQTVRFFGQCPILEGSSENRSEKGNVRKAAKNVSDQYFPMQKSCFFTFQHEGTKLITVHLLLWCGDHFDHSACQLLLNLVVAGCKYVGGGCKYVGVLLLRSKVSGIARAPVWGANPFLFLFIINLLILLKRLTRLAVEVQSNMPGWHVHCTVCEHTHHYKIQDDVGGAISVTMATKRIFMVFWPISWILWKKYCWGENVTACVQPWYMVGKGVRFWTKIIWQHCMSRFQTDVAFHTQPCFPFVHLTFIRVMLSITIHTFDSTSYTSTRK